MATEFFADLVGQDRAIALLSQAVRRDRVAPAYLFAGPDGVGRRRAARCFATLLFAPSGCEAPPPGLAQRLAAGNHPDLLWVEPTYLDRGKLLTVSEAREAGFRRQGGPQIRLEQVREIGRFLGRLPLEAPRSLVILDGAETMAEGAANGLLKTLEEPGQASLILLAPSPDALLPTLVSRCARIPFRRLSGAELATVLERTGHGELAQRPELLAIAQGSPGSAIAQGEILASVPADLLDQLQMPPRSPRAALTLAKRIDHDLDGDQQLWLTGYLQQRYWHQTGGHFDAIAAARLLETARQHLRNYVQPRLVWEITCLRLARLLAA
jgi:DNA polymerase-3 subunit delta'